MNNKNSVFSIKVPPFLHHTNTHMNVKQIRSQIKWCIKWILFSFSSGLLEQILTPTTTLNTNEKKSQTHLPQIPSNLFLIGIETQWAHFRDYRNAIFTHSNGYAHTRKKNHQTSFFCTPQFRSRKKEKIIVMNRSHTQHK